MALNRSSSASGSTDLKMSRFRKLPPTCRHSYFRGHGGHGGRGYSCIPYSCCATYMRGEGSRGCASAACRTEQATEGTASSAPSTTAPSAATIPPKGGGSEMSTSSGIWARARRGRCQIVRSFTRPGRSRVCITARGPLAIAAARVAGHLGDDLVIRDEDVQRLVHARPDALRQRRPARVSRAVGLSPGRAARAGCKARLQHGEPEHERGRPLVVAVHDPPHRPGRAAEQHLTRAFCHYSLPNLVYMENPYKRDA